VLPATSHFFPPGNGVLDRWEWLVSIIRPFLDASPPTSADQAPR
jgi:hypothetical protein